MQTDEERKIFSENLQRMMKIKGKRQGDISYELDLPKSTISAWICATRMPKMGTIQTLSEYFHCSKSELIEKYCEEHDNFAKNSALNPDEIAIINNYRKSNDIGKNKIRDYSFDIANIDYYKIK